MASGDLSVIESSGAFAETNYFAFVPHHRGFGDINPALPLARMLSVVTSIAGPLYLAVVMGVLIGRLLEGTGRFKSAPVLAVHPANPISGDFLRTNGLAFEVATATPKTFLHHLLLHGPSAGAPLWLSLG